MAEAWQPDDQRQQSISFISNDKQKPAYAISNHAHQAINVFHALPLVATMLLARYNHLRLPAATGIAAVGFFIAVEV